MSARPAQRIARVSESLLAMKLIKLYAWSEAFLTEIATVRDRQMRHLWQYNMYRCARAGTHALATRAAPPPPAPPLVAATQSSPSVFCSA